MAESSKVQRGEALPRTDTELLRRMVSERGECAVAAHFKVNRLTLARAAAGFTLQQKTHAAIQVRLVVDSVPAVGHVTYTEPEMFDE